MINNIFDRNTFNINEYPVSPAAKVIIDDGAKMFKIGKIALLACFIILTFISNAIHLSFGQSYFYLFAFLELYIGYRSIVRILMNRKIIKLNTNERFDLYLYQFHKAKERNKRGQEKMLLYMAKEDIVAGNYDRAAMAIGLIDPSKLKGFFRKLYNIITYSISLRGSDFAAAERMYNEYAQNDVSAMRTFPEAAELWNWRNSFSPERSSYIIGNINSINPDARIWTIVLNALAFASWLIGYANGKLRFVPIMTSNVSIIYCAVMALISLICFVSFLLLALEGWSYTAKTRRRLYICILVICGLIVIVWAFRALALIGDWLLWWM